MGGASALIRVMLIDAQESFLRKLSSVLQRDADIEVVATVSAIDKALSTYRRERPNACLLGVTKASAPEPELDILAQLLAEDPQANVAAVAHDADDALVVEVVRRGVNGFLIKEAPDSEFVAAVREMAQGGVVFAKDALAVAIQELRERLATTAVDVDCGRQRSRGKSKVEILAKLSEREIEVFLLVAEGLSNREISNRLHVTEGTVKNHVSNISRKLGLHRRAELMIYAWRQGLKA